MQKGRTSSKRSRHVGVNNEDDIAVETRRRVFRPVTMTSSLAHNFDFDREIVLAVKEEVNNVLNFGSGHCSGGC
jgi:hypothetical protein